VIKLENGHRANLRKRLTRLEWAEIRTAYASGIGLRELGRNMGIPAGTILARAKREGWSKQIQSAKALAKRDDTSTALTPFEAVSASMQQRGERHIGRMAGIVERGTGHVEAMEPGRSSIASMTLTRWTRSDAALSNWTIIRQPGGSTFQSCRLAATLISVRKRRRDVSSLLLGWRLG
jgi:hypothetical protein